jgi:hypothetical protein
LLMPKFTVIALFMLPLFVAIKVLSIIIIIYCRPSQLTKGENNGISI